MTSRVAIDIGGTFTDVIGFDPASGSVAVGKTLSTPQDLVQGILAGMGAADIPVDGPDTIVHGSTVVINALIERRGVRTALVTTDGFRDLYSIGRVNRPDAFDMAFRQHDPLLERDAVFEVSERMLSDGSVHVPLDESDARSIAAQIREQGFDAIAVVFLHSYRSPAHEIRMGEILGEECPGVFVTLSHSLTREYREFERTSTAVANAFVGPLVSDYLERIETRLEAEGSTAALGIMQSNGGLSDVRTAREQPIQMLESGPAGGVVGTIELCRQIGYSNAIAFDMGGTTAKAAVIRDLEFPQSPEYFVGGYVRGLPIRISCLDIVEVGTGGGSIAWLDEGRGLHVGPRSAGAEPGPACYGRGGTEPTVTDAAAALGLISADRKLSGGLTLDIGAATEGLSVPATRIGLSTTELAGGVIAIAASSMANAVRAVTTERGLDPRDFALFAYGGNGPVYVSLIARDLGVRDVVIPPHPAVFSALGMLMADLRQDVALTDIRTLEQIGVGALRQDLDALNAASAERLLRAGVTQDAITFSHAADMRYHGQEHTITVLVPEIDGNDAIDALRQAFDFAHQERFGHSAPAESVELVTLRASAVAAQPRPSFPRVPEGSDSPDAAALLGSRRVVFDYAAEPFETAVYDRAALRVGNRITGPAAIEEGTTTTILAPGDALTVDAYGNLLISIGEAS